MVPSVTTMASKEASVADDGSGSLFGMVSECVVVNKDVAWQNASGQTVFDHFVEVTISTRLAAR